MTISTSEKQFLDAVSLDLPWSLVERFSTMPRWRPEDVNRGAEVIIEKLRAAGVPVEVHAPEIYLSVPYSASVSAGGTTVSEGAMVLTASIRTGGADSFF